MDSAPARSTESAAGGTPSSATVQDVVNSLPLIGRLAAAPPLPVAAALKLRRLKATAGAIGADFNRARNALIAGRGEPHGAGWRLRPDQMDSFQAELAPLLAAPVALAPDIRLAPAALEDARLSDEELRLLAYALCAE